MYRGHTDGGLRAVVKCPGATAVVGNSYEAHRLEGDSLEVVAVVADVRNAEEQGQDAGHFQLDLELEGVELALRAPWEAEVRHSPGLLKMVGVVVRNKELPFGVLVPRVLVVGVVHQDRC